MRIDPIWRLPLLAGGAFPANSYAELTGRGLRLRFGCPFDRTIPYDEIKDVFTRSWPLLYGIGWRSNLRGVIGLIGSYENVVEVRLKRRTRAWLVFPCDRIGVSLEDPAGFIAALRERAGLDSGGTAGGHRRRRTAARKRAPRRKG
jgi:hypothetical protein